MKPLIAINFYRQSELEKVSGFAKLFGSDFRGISNLKTDLTSWHFDSMKKNNVEWTRRFLSRFLDESNYDCLIKIDPDTVIAGDLPLPVLGGDVAGDFRLTPFGWAWFGGYHFFTRSAVVKILGDPEYSGPTTTQDMPLTRTVIRQKLKMEQLASVNCWKLRSDADTIISHFGATRLPLTPPGLIQTI